MTTAGRRPREALVGTWGLVRLTVRRDRVLGPIWIVGLALLPPFYLAALRATYPGAGRRAELSASIATSVVERIETGRVYADSLGALTAWRSGLVPVFAGVAGVLVLVRHSRAEEESGRLELLRGQPVGRLAPTTAALVLSCGAQLVLGLLIAAGCTAAGLGAAGSLALGSAFAAAGLVFTAVGALAVELTSGARTARGSGLSVLAVSFALRAVGDVGGRGTGVAMWVSPLGWVEQVRPLAGDRWWVLGLPLALTGAGIAASLALAARRDLGGSLLPGRRAPAHAAGWLRGPLTLTWRLSRGGFAAWAVGCVLLGTIGGAALPAAAGQIRSSPAMRSAVTDLTHTTDIPDALLGAVAGLIGLLVTAYSVAGIGRARSEEVAGRLDLVLAAPVTRNRWAAAVLGWAALAPVVLLGLGGLALGAAAALAGGAGPAPVGRAAGATLVQLPAVWCTAGIAAVAFGLLPRAVAAGWAALAAVVLLGQLAGLAHLPAAVRGVSPFAHLPHLPGGTVTAGPLIALVAVAGVLGAVALAGMRHRDIG